jgi:hypothetical protein
MSKSSIGMSEFAIYALTAHGRQIQETEIGGRNLYRVQPKGDNYWLWCRTPHAALQAFYAPRRFRAASDRLAAWVEKQKNAEHAERRGVARQSEDRA